MKHCRYCYYAKSKFGIFYCGKDMRWFRKQYRNIPDEVCSDYLDMRDKKGHTPKRFKILLKKEGN